MKLTSGSAILRRVAEELGDVRRLRGIEGWTDALSARALAALRIVATYAVSHPVNQVPGHGIQPHGWAARGADKRPEDS
jgi:hypothetical protein